jgi:hypothetical protein
VKGKENKFNKYPFIVVYRGNNPKAFYEGPFGDESKKNSKSQSYKDQVAAVTKILKDFILKYAKDKKFDLTNSALLDEVRKAQWEEYNKGFKKEEGIILDVFNYIESAKNGYVRQIDSTGTKFNLYPVIPAVPSLYFKPPPPKVNLLGQKDDTIDPLMNDIIIIKPSLLPLPDRKFPDPKNEDEKKKIEEEKKKFQEQVNKIKQENKKLEIEEVFMPALPTSYYFDSKDNTIKKK